MACEPFRFRPFGGFLLAALISPTTIADTVAVDHISRGMINGADVNFELNTDMNTVTGDFGGDFRINAALATLREIGDGFFSELIMALGV